MLLEIISTTDGKFIGNQIDSSIFPMPLGKDQFLRTERVFQTGKRLWRLATSTYVIDAREVHNG